MLGDVRATLTGSWLNRRKQFFKAIWNCDMSDLSRCIWNRASVHSFYASTKYEEYLLTDNALCFYALDTHPEGPAPWAFMPLLFWAGGTYARRPEYFPQEQSSAPWLEEHLLPLAMEAPGFRGHISLEKLAKTWRLAKWHGRAPHPFAIKEPFPYAVASMRAYCVDYVATARCRELSLIHI